MLHAKFEGNGFDAKAYRSALGRFATGVALIAVRDDEGQPRAITVNSFASISLDPPIISWAIDEASDRYHLFTEARDFTVNVLRGSQQDLAVKFTRKAEARIDAENLEMDGEVPGVAGVLSRLTCATRFLEKVGDHTVVFATVRAFQDFGPGPALGFLDGRFITIGED